jgi:FtsH-binding integral membrane protein
MANQNFNTFNRAGTTDLAFDAGLRAHMIRVYNYMASGLALSGIVAFALFSSSELASIFFQVAPGNRVVGLNMLGWIAIFAPMGLLLLVGFRAQQMSVAGVQAVYWAVTALMGVSMSLLLFRYTGASAAFNLGGILGGGLAPFVAQALAVKGGLAPVGLALSAAALLSLAGLAPLKREEV